MKIGLKDHGMGKKVALHKSNRNERGYALVGIIGVILFALILTTAAAPSIKLEMQREKEEEMLWRGQQIAAALGRYRGIGNTQFPTDLKELVEGINDGIKKVRLLRPSALCDPMTPCEPDSTNWRLVHPGDPLIRELYDAYLDFQQKSGTSMQQPPPQELQAMALQTSIQLPGQGGVANAAGLSTSANQGETAAPPPDSGNESDFGLSKLPIVGVVSRKSGEMFRNYYGIERYDHALFFRNLEVKASGFNPGTRLTAPTGGLSPDGGANGAGLNSPGLNGVVPNGTGINGTIPNSGAPNNGVPAQTNDANAPCPYGGVRINGVCSGGLYPGPQQRAPTPAP